MALFILAIAVIVFPQQPASAATPTSATAAADLCTLEEWQVNVRGCIDRLADVASSRTQCLKAPIPDTPDSGLGGWFASRPAATDQSGYKGYYVLRGYAGYSYTTYDIGCAPTLMHPDYKFENTVANGEFFLASAILGASNAVRERAWDPGTMWSWADPLVDKATKSIYARVFTVFGAVTLAVVGIYLLWRSRQAEMSAAMTTAGWALLVMVAVTALAAWPVRSAHLADQTLISSLNAVHDAVGPPTATVSREQCPFADYSACVDIRPPAIRASDTTVKTMLYRNWIRGALGSEDSTTAQKYGYALYASRTISWLELDTLRSTPEARDEMIASKANDWMKVAEQIKTEDPEAYQYLQGTRGMERIGAGFIALLSAAMFALFDLVASLLVLIGFVIFRWAVIAAPLVGTVALLRPASAGFRRLANSVVAAVFNIVVFGTGAAIYLYAVDIIMSTVAIPGWLQVVIIALCGVVGWLLLRPYRRITQLGGKDPLAIASAGALFNRRQARLEESAVAATAVANQTLGAGPRPVPSQRTELRPEPAGGDGRTATVGSEPESPPTVPSRREFSPTASSELSEADAGYSVYRPNRRSMSPQGPTAPSPAQPRTRVEAGTER